MLHGLIRSFFPLLLFGIIVPVSAQTADGCSNCYTAQEAREDLQVLFTRLQKEHVNLFARRSKAEYEARLQELLSRIDGPIKKSEFHLMLHEAMAFGNIGHSKTEAALADVFGHIGNGGKIIPLSIVYRGDRMITDNWTGTSDALPPGSRITALAGVPVEEFENGVRKIVSADTLRLLRTQVEMGMPAYLYLKFGPVDNLLVDYIAPNGEAGSHRIKAVTFGEMYSLQDARALPRPTRKPGARIHRDLGEGIFYLQPGPFSATKAERGEDGDAYLIEPFRAFISEAFAAMAESEAQDLIIDLRDNGGGDASFSDLIIARLIDNPYRFASRYEVRAGPNTKAVWFDRPRDRETLAGRIAAAVADAEDGEVVSIELPETQPIADNAFGGRVWVLVNRHSYSNAAVIAALMQDLGIATIFGEETADLPTTYGAVETFDLPHSGSTIIYPKAYMVRPSGSEETRGVVPNFLIAPTHVGESQDLMLQVATRQILLSR
ncbi:S41 family peptidase [Qipengyuania sp. GH38]|uniref:S41 family peptidase n=1 Tax=Qipengyuania intermedia TaxID=2867244 RepID=UPI001C87E868|nr:S41 family peptidase [Qipengyuania intermedia]MBX7513382.1 S41 family peptidase [Qipengyuania intermedia]